MRAQKANAPAPDPRLPLLLQALLAIAPAAAWAQNTPQVPDAGSVARQVEQARPQPPAQRGPGAALTSPPPPAKGAATVSVRRFVLRGHTAVDEALLQADLQPWLNTPLDHAGLLSAVSRIEATYLAQGRMASVRMGRQDVTEGLVTFDILEARFAGARIEGRSPTRVPAELLLAQVAAHLRVGELLDTHAMNRVLLLLDDLPGVAITGSLAAGREPGDTQLVLEVADEARWATRLQADNTGSRSVGSARLTLQASLNSPLQRGDLAQFSALASEGSAYARLAYSHPLGLHGLRAQAWATQMDYRVISPELRDLHAKGRSSTAGASLSWPMLRSRSANLTANLSTEHKRFSNEANASVTTRYRSRSTQTELSGSLFDGLLGGGANSATLSYTQGQQDLAGSPSLAADAQSAQTAGRWERWNVQLTRQQRLSDDFSLFFLGSAQRANRNLDSSERMGLGGLSGVRAYPANEASGSNGQLASLELRHRTTDRLSLTGFYDTGRTQLYVQPLAPGGQSLLAGAPNRYRLEGVGVSANWLALDALQLQMTIARRLGSHPNPSPSGTDQDGSRARTRVWLSASFSL